MCQSMEKGRTGDEREKERAQMVQGLVDCRKQLGLHFEGTGESPVGFTQGRGLGGFRFFSIWLLCEEQVGRGKGGGSENREMVSMVQSEEGKGGAWMQVDQGDTLKLEWA